MRIWADLYNAAGVRQGTGPVWALTDASITRLLDGAGSVQVNAPGTEQRAIELLTNERRMIVRGLQPSGVEGKPTIRQLGSGIIRDIKAKAAPSGWQLSADGPDTLDELKRWSTLLARVYAGMTLGQITSDLAALAGWTVTLDADFVEKQVQYRFDGISVLKALQTIAAGQGLHIREGVTGRHIEMGGFGQVTNIRLVNAAYAPFQIHGNDDAMLIETLSVDRMSEQLVNWLLPIGGGEGESAVTLEHCTRTGPYPVRTVVVAGKTHYYLADETSMAIYGTIQKVGTFKEVVPISNSDADLEAAANALYDAAVAWLVRNKDRIDTYRVTVKKVRRTVRPGDKVRLTYKGTVTNDKGVIVNYVSVDSDFWVMKATERIGLEGVSLNLEVSNIDQMAMDAAQVVMGAIESIQMQQLRVQPYPSGGTFVYRREMDSTHTAIVPIEITTGVLYLNQARLFIKSRPFRTTAVSVGSSEVTTSAGGSVATSSAAGGNHFHKIASYIRIDDPGGGWASGQAAVYDFAFTSGGGAPAALGLPIRGAGDVAHDIYTEGASGTHQHTITIPAHTHTVPAILTDFGISDDDEYPNTVSVAVNGIDVTAALGGPWGTEGAAVDTAIDITAYLVNASGGLRQRHEVTFSCASGQGEIEVTVELRTTVQSIAVTS